MFHIKLMPRSHALSSPKVGGGQWFAMQRDEAVVLLICTPPPAKYFGLTAYVTSRLLYNGTETGDGDASLVPHFAMAELHDPLNQLRLNSTAGTAPAAGDKFFGATSLIVLAPSRAVFEWIATAFVDAGLPKEAVNFYPVSGQVVRLHRPPPGAGLEVRLPGPPHHRQPGHVLPEPDGGPGVGEPHVAGAFSACACRR
jgi:hypothetical protein